MEVIRNGETLQKYIYVFFFICIFIVVHLVFFALYTTRRKKVKKQRSLKVIPFDFFSTLPSVERHVQGHALVYVGLGFCLKRMSRAKPFYSF